MDKTILKTPIARLYKRYPFFSNFFEAYALTPPSEQSDETMEEWIENQEFFVLDEVGVDREELPENFVLFVRNMIDRRNTSVFNVDSITVVGGHDKEGKAENCEITLSKGDVVSIVGPTGSGKSRLLADIEWLAQGDTETGRKVLINGKTPPADWRFSIDRKMVAQLSQNMNFVMDITVEQFLKIHCESRMLRNIEERTARILQAANELSGEELTLDMPVTSLSGGQSRALMIADTAWISASPIILIDEIENAGIDRKQAVDLLIQAEKIVLMATHDPVLALQAKRRIVIKNGGIYNVIETTENERELLGKLESMNQYLNICRDQLRKGNVLEEAYLEKNY